MRRPNRSRRTGGGPFCPKNYAADPVKFKISNRSGILTPAARHVLELISRRFGVRTYFVYAYACSVLLSYLITPTFFFVLKKLLF